MLIYEVLSFTQMIPALLSFPLAQLYQQMPSGFNDNCKVWRCCYSEQECLGRAEVSEEPLPASYMAVRLEMLSQCKLLRGRSL